MRLAFAFIACLLSLFANGKPHPAQTVQQPFHVPHVQLAQKQFAQYSNADQGDTLIDDTDLDFTEDNYSSNAKENLKCFTGSRLPYCAHLIRRRLVLAYRPKAAAAFPPFLAQLPRYLAHGVLRI